MEDAEISPKPVISPKPGTDISPVVGPVTIQPKNVYGLRSDVINNVHFNIKQEVIYPVESVLAFHDYVANKQKFLRLADATRPLMLALSPNRRLLAVLEETKSELGPELTISVYDMTTLKKRRTFELPNDKETTYEIGAMHFTHDSKTIALLTNPPDETIILFYFDKVSTLLQVRVANTNQPGRVICIAAHPEDANLIAVGGYNIFKLMTKTETGCVVSNNLRESRLYLISMTWLNAETVVAGTRNGMLWILDITEVKQKLDAIETQSINLLQEAEDEIETAENAAQRKLQEREEKPVLCLRSFQTGFAYAVFNKVYVFGRESRDKYERKTIITINIDLYPEAKYNIRNIAINAKCDTIVVTAQHHQIYVAVLIVPESLKTKHLQFKPLGESIHTDEILHISMCSWRPIIMTASKDYTVRIWNYETEKVELIKKYQAVVSVIELNATGLIAALAFSDQLRVMEVFYDDFKILKTYNFPGCKDVKYSNFGHYMAAAYGNLIAITSVFNLETLRILKGHNGDVLSLAWSRNDKYLISAGIEGAIYQWDVETGARVNEVIQKGVEYRSIAVTQEPLTIYAITSLGTLREIKGSEVIRELKSPLPSNLLSLSLSKSDLVLFISSNDGHLYNVQLPFLDAGGGTFSNYRFFSSGVTKCCISHDGTLLVTATREGTLAIWVLKNIDGRVAHMDQDLLKCQEILVPRAILQDKVETIRNLELRLKQQLAEFTYQSKQAEIFDEQALADVHRTYVDYIEELKQKHSEIEEAHVQDLNRTAEEILERDKNHETEMKTLSDQYAERILSEYSKFINLRDNMIAMRDDYEQKLRRSAGCLQDTIEALETDFKKQLQERQELIRQIMQEMEDRKQEFIEYCHQVEIDNDKNMIESQLQYEQKLKNEQDSTHEWRGQAGVLKKKYAAMSEEAEALREECDILKVEHSKFKKEIDRHLRVNDDLRKELEERDFVIGEKEKRIQEVMHKNQELEKYKQVLGHKIGELKAQIEPRERQIKEKRDQISEMERELEGLNSSNLKLEVQMRELKDKYISNFNELRTEREYSRVARLYTSKICVDIFHVASNLNQPLLLKDGIQKLFRKYADDRELKRTILVDQQVRSEFERQRDYLEGVILKYKKLEQKKGGSGDIQNRLINDNALLVTEMNNLREQLKDTQQQLQLLESVIGGGFKSVSTFVIRQKIKKAVTDVEKIEEKHKLELENMQKKIEEVLELNRELRADMQIKSAQLEISKDLVEISKDGFDQYENM